MCIDRLEVQIFNNINAMKNMYQKACLLTSLMLSLTSLNGQVNPSMEPDFFYQNRIIFTSSEVSSATVNGMDLTAVMDYDNSIIPPVVHVDIVDRTGGGGANLLQTLVISSPSGGSCNPGDVQMTHGGENLYVVYDCASPIPGGSEQVFLDKYYFDSFSGSYIPMATAIFIGDGRSALIDMGPEGFGGVVYSNRDDIFVASVESDPSNVSNGTVNVSPPTLVHTLGTPTSTFSYYDIAAHEPYSLPTLTDIRYTVALLDGGVLHAITLDSPPGLAPIFHSVDAFYDVEGGARVRICSPKENGMVAHTSPYTEFTIAVNKSATSPYNEDLGLITGDASIGGLSPFVGVNSIPGSSPCTLAVDFKSSFYCSYAIDWNQNSAVSMTWHGPSAACMGETFSVEFDPTSSTYLTPPGMANAVSAITQGIDESYAPMSSSMNSTEIVPVFALQKYAQSAPNIFIVVSADYMIKSKDLVGMTVFPSTYKTALEENLTGEFNLIMESDHQWKLTFPSLETSTQIALFSISGALVFEREVDASNNEITLSLADLASGVYVVNCKRGEQTESFRIIR
ncbi:hypothetical protein GCM10011318_08820 [Phaeocystidibacter marisrubri]|uniref:T9SS type A sorting domain-containing protein n=2 Tax=Phaeocystidibacter marisrubri TaxID=1577780 RepID=A0A6L3ZEV3_9FLAO|nr:T9SS type A sorting domain-containing protein [Phaeocystidibacter marisrubri]GGH68616.1 hypothetical protein GCM10011318_08820 [Phaeocystidibacter marisrubri]